MMDNINLLDVFWAVYLLGFMISICSFTAVFLKAIKTIYESLTPKEKTLIESKANFYRTYGDFTGLEFLGLLFVFFCPFFNLIAGIIILVDYKILSKVLYDKLMPEYREFLMKKQQNNKNNNNMEE